MAGCYQAGYCLPSLWHPLSKFCGKCCSGTCTTVPHSTDTTWPCGTVNGRNGLIELLCHGIKKSAVRTTRPQLYIRVPHQLVFNLYRYVLLVRITCVMPIFISNVNQKKKQKNKKFSTYPASSCVPKIYAFGKIAQILTITLGQQ